MSAETRKTKLHKRLIDKTTKELEELLYLDFVDDNASDAEYISAILEVMEEKKQETEDNIEEAWKEFQAYCQEAKTYESETSETLTHDHQNKPQPSQKPRKYGTVWKASIAAAAVVVMLCNNAFGWNLFQVVVEWTEENLLFLADNDAEELPKQETLDLLRIAVEDYTDVSVVPCRAPNKTQEYGNLSIREQNDKYIIGKGYTTDTGSFFIRITVYRVRPELQIGTYQKDSTIYEKYRVNGITHHIVGNNENLSAIWINGWVEGHIQGNLTVEELQQMIDSIYEES